MQTKKLLIVLVAALMIFASAQTSRAVLNAVDPGPYLAGNGFFPGWYQDPNGLGLAPCLDSPAPLGTGLCVVLSDPFFNAASPIVFPTNWPTEFFYWIADADKNTLPAWIKVFRFALEGSFATLGVPPSNGQQAVFQRIRFRFTPPVTGTYTITHPFGSKTFTSVPAGVEIRDTTDIPLGIALDFIGALAGPIGPYLKWDPAVLPAAPVGYIGDAVTAHKVVGSPTGNNFVRVDGPAGSAIGGVGQDFVQTDLFVVAGKITAVLLPTPLTVDRTSYNLTAAGPQIDVFAKSTPAATLTFNDGTVAANAMAHDSSGRFFGRSTNAIPAPVAPATLPAVTVNASGAGSPSTTSSNLVDVVNINVAEYSVLGQTLTIEASSSDQVNAPVLTADGGITLPPVVGVPGAASTIIPGVLAPPAFVTVTSSKGGSASVPVIVLP